MAKAKCGDTVKVHFTGRLENDEVFDTSKDDQPFIFTIGTVKVIPGFEKGIVGMEVGQTKKITVPPEEAYGSRQEELVFDLKKSDFLVTPVIGQHLQLRRRSGDSLKVTVTGVDEDTVTLDANHPLARKPLLFKVKLVEIA